MLKKKIYAFFIKKFLILCIVDNEKLKEKNLFLIFSYIEVHCWVEATDAKGLEVENYFHAKIMEINY